MLDSSLAFFCCPSHICFNGTGYQFKETLELRDRIRDRYGITVSYESQRQLLKNTKDNTEGHVSN